MAAPPPPEQVQLTLTVPPGVCEGQLMTFQAPSGQTMQIAVPSGVPPGGTVTVMVPAAAPSPTPAQELPSSPYPTAPQPSAHQDPAPSMGGGDGQAIYSSAPAAPADAPTAPPPEQVQLTLTVPPGVCEGQLMTFQAPSGETMQITVPSGVPPGGTVTVMVPAAAPSPAPAQEPPNAQAGSTPDVASGSNPQAADHQDPEPNVGGGEGQAIYSSAPAAPADAPTAPPPEQVQLTLTVPVGVCEGQLMTFQAPNGETRQIAVPSGVPPGGTVTFKMPAVAPSPIPTKEPLSPPHPTAPQPSAHRMNHTLCMNTGSTQSMTEYTTNPLSVQHSLDVPSPGGVQSGQNLKHGLAFTPAPVVAQAGIAMRSPPYTANPLTCQPANQMGMAPAGSDHVPVMMAPVPEQMNTLSEVCSPKSGWTHESKIAAYSSSAFTDPVVNFEPTAANNIVRFVNGFLTQMACFIFCTPCALYIYGAKVRKLIDEIGMSAEEKADKNMKKNVAETQEMLANVALGKMMVSTGLELFFVQLFETYRERNHFGDVVAKAYMSAPNDPAHGSALMATAINNEINDFMQSIFITYYQRGHLEVCDFCSSVVAYEGYFTWYVGHVSKQHRSYVGSVKERMTLGMFYPDLKTNVHFRYLRDYLRTDTFRNALAMILKQVTLRAAKLNLQEFSKKSPKRRYHQTQIRPFLKSWLQHQFNVPET